jgi:hypothetical protein
MAEEALENIKKQIQQIEKEAASNVKPRLAATLDECVEFQLPVEPQGTEALPESGPQEAHLWTCCKAYGKLVEVNSTTGVTTVQGNHAWHDFDSSTTWPASNGVFPIHSPSIALQYPSMNPMDPSVFYNFVIDQLSTPGSPFVLNIGDTIVLDFIFGPNTASPGVNGGFCSGFNCQDVQKICLEYKGYNTNPYVSWNGGFSLGQYLDGYIYLSDCCNTPPPSSYCYYIGNVGPGDGRIFSIPDPTTINQTHYYYESSPDQVSAHTHMIGGTPDFAFNDLCESPGAPTTHTRVGWTTSNINAVLTFNSGNPINGIINSELDPSTIQPGMRVESIDPVTGNNVFTPGTEVINVAGTPGTWLVFLNTPTIHTLGSNPIQNYGTGTFAVGPVVFKDPAFQTEELWVHPQQLSTTVYNPTYGWGGFAIWPAWATGQTNSQASMNSIVVGMEVVGYHREEVNSYGSWSTSGLVWPPNTKITHVDVIPINVTQNLIHFYTDQQPIRDLGILNGPPEKVMFNFHDPDPGWSIDGSEFGAYRSPYPTINTLKGFSFGFDNTDAIDSFNSCPGITPCHPVTATNRIAATACLQYGGPQGNDDWYLPSLYEFQEMYTQVGALLTWEPDGGNSEHIYWTSSQYVPDASGTLPNPENYAWAFNTVTGQPVLAYRCHALSVRPIRRLECEPDRLYNFRDVAHKWNYDNAPLKFWMTGGFVNITLAGTAGSLASGSLAMSLSIDGLIGMRVFRISFATTDVMGNIYKAENFDDSQNPNGYTFTIWDDDKNFLGKWKYRSCKDIKRINNPLKIGPPIGPSSHSWYNIKDFPDFFQLRFEYVTHLAGPSPVVAYGNNKIVLNPPAFYPPITRNPSYKNAQGNDYYDNCWQSETASNCYIKIESDTIVGPYENVDMGPNTTPEQMNVVCAMKPIEDTKALYLSGQLTNLNKSGLLPESGSGMGVGLLGNIHGAAPNQWGSGNPIYGTPYNLDAGNWNVESVMGSGSGITAPIHYMWAWPASFKPTSSGLIWNQNFTDGLNNTQGPCAVNPPPRTFNFESWSICRYWRMDPNTGVFGWWPDMSQPAMSNDPADPNFNTMSWPPAHYAIGADRHGPMRKANSPFGPDYNDFPGWMQNIGAQSPLTVGDEFLLDLEDGVHVCFLHAAPYSIYFTKLCLKYHGVKQYPTVQQWMSPGNPYYLGLSIPDVIQNWAVNVPGHWCCSGPVQLPPPPTYIENIKYIKLFEPPETKETEPPPPGFHYMPDGTLMSDEEHIKLYGSLDSYGEVQDVVEDIEEEELEIQPPPEEPLDEDLPPGDTGDGY